MAIGLRYPVWRRVDCHRLDCQLASFRPLRDPERGRTHQAATQNCEKVKKMKAINVLKSLGPIDIRGVRRDSLLSWMVLIPIFIGLLIRFAVPPLTQALIDQYNFDLSPYYPVIMAYFFILMDPLLFGVVIGFLLLDERDDGTLTALQITPLPMRSYLAYRIILPMVLSILLMFVVYPIAGLGYLNFTSLLIAAVASAPIAPFMALAYASFAQNKVQGFALMKASGIILIPPVFAFFIDSQWELLFGLLPTYWPMKVYWMLEAGSTNIWLYTLIGVLYSAVLVWVFARRFNKVLHQ
jgi:fluoroquinolone transport system permease protein